MPASSSSRQKPSLPPETRIYAIGDIHGRADLLRDTILRIDDDLRRRPITYAAEVYVGDYIDRGADAYGVIELLAARTVESNVICLRGNHEAMMEEFLHSPDNLQDWRQLGALQTLASYGVQTSRSDSDRELQRQFGARVPPLHKFFLRGLRNSIRCGDFLFVHAGIRPRVALDRQDPNDLLWIRDDFLNSPDDHGAYVVHGHTPVPHADIRPNRINIDTGAWRTGVLTCVAIEGTDIMVL